MCHYPKTSITGKEKSGRICLKTVHDQISETHRTALHLASLNGNYRCIKALIKHGAKLDEVDKYGQTPLALSLLKNHCNAVKRLLEFGASKLNIKTEQNCSKLITSQEL